ncbi:hypothetical protein BGZ63DRAFT_415449 [Mariannaea sp. PMI_226]|nr:hypothetical protein BGZ63DRAFT_415449 [Mariannaea sp. PMI_226]
MTSTIAKFWVQKILGESVSNKFGTEDPYFEQVPATRLNGTPSGKVKKRKKALPPGISEHDAKVLTKVKRRAYRLDLSLFNCCGIRFGWSSAIALVPAIGDALDALMALMVVKTCMQVEDGLPATLRTRMLFNIALDFFVGLVPFVGDVADALFRANTRNAALLEAHLREKGKKNLRRSGQPLPAVDPSDPEEFDRLQMTDTPPEYTSQAPEPNEHMMSDRPPRTTDRSHERVPDEPEPARVRQSRGWFGGRKARPHDIEAGDVRLESTRQKSSSRRERR